MTPTYSPPTMATLSRTQTIHRYRPASFSAILGRKVDLMRMFSLILAAIWVLSVAVPAGFAQFLFLDANGDGRNDQADRIAATGTASIDVWLQTDRNGDGSLAQCRGRATLPFGINSYEFILRCSGGTVEWGEYTNFLPAMFLHIGPLENATDYYQNFASLGYLPPGKYKLGRLTLKATSGNPRIAFASSSSVWRGAGTSFGSQCDGKDGDHTLRFTEDPTKLGSPIVEQPGDWADARGLQSPHDAVESAQALATATPSFAVSISPNPANPNATIEVRTTKAGPLRVQLFSISGRLVRTLINARAADAGLYSVRIPGRFDKEALPSGVYVYRVEAIERTVTGKLVLLK